MSDQESTVTGARQKIVAAAQDLAVSYQNSSYKKGGKTTAAFDCSYFVYLVFNSVFSDYRYMDSDAIISSPALFKKHAVAAPGDVVFFPAQQVPNAVAKGDTTEYPNHVGIVIDSSKWVGRQSSSVGAVLFANPWWGPRQRSYYAYAFLDPTIGPAAPSNGTRQSK